jgi:tRNA pseudouridine38-40 synthase
MSQPIYNYKLTIAYDGTNYCGWQIQPNGVTIQETIQKALAIILRENIKIIGSGRTDTGVHASGQVAHFKYHQKINLRSFKHSLNGLLPLDIRVKEILEVPINFHAQYSAMGKIYHYHLHLDPVLNPFSRLYSTHVYTKIDMNLFKQAALLFLGTHDFTSFANEAHTGVAAHDPIRTLTRLDIVPVDGGFRLEFEGNGFLYKMVRNIVGTLLEVGTGKIKIDQIPLIFEAKDRRLAGRAAPPQGLFLVKVHY